MKFDTNKIESLIDRLKEVRMAGTLDGESADRRENLRRLFMYPAMMVPATQGAIIQIFAEELDLHYAIDPFMGSGTSLLSCMEYGMSVYGQDINPFAVLLSKAKMTWYDSNVLIEKYEQLKWHIEHDEGLDVDVSFKGIDKWFTIETQISLSKIRRAIKAEESLDYRCFFWVLMSEVIRTGSNDRTSTFKLHRRSEEELRRRKVDILREFYSMVERGINDYRLYQRKFIDVHGDRSDSGLGGERVVTWGNSQKPLTVNHKYDILVSSPPYGDNHTTVTYGQTSYLPLCWIDPDDIDCPYEYLRSTQEIDRQSLGGQINRKELNEKREALLLKTQSLRDFVTCIPEKDQPKYDKTIRFIMDFDETLDNIIAVMEDDAFYVWTIGNRFVGGREVPNDKILIDLMQSRGISLFFQAERVIHNKKQAPKNNFSRTMEKEQILIFHKS